MKTIGIDIVKTYVLPLIEKRITPKINNLVNSKLLKIERIHHNLYVNRFKDYLSRKYESYLTIDTLVLQNQQVHFHSLYFPLTVNGWSVNKTVTFKVDKYHENFIPEFHRVLIVDTAGMGKSTILKKLFLSSIEENKNIPVFIELRKLNASNDILNDIYNQISPIDSQIDKDFILHLLKEGDFTFFFDGFDEIPLADKDFVVKNLHEFIFKCNRCHFVISSRPEDSLASFSDFQKFTINPLKKEESYELIKSYSSIENKKNSDQLISILEQKKNNVIHEFLKTPLLVTLLYAAFDYGREIPFEKAQFYSLVYDALFHRHDYTKEGYFKRQKFSKLHRDNFEKILRGIGYITFREGKIEHTRLEILNAIERAKSKYKLDFNPSDFFEDLIRTVPLFRKDGNYYKWSHKSMQDYFAARFIVVDTEGKSVEKVRELYNAENKSKFIEIFDLIYYLDYKTFRNSIIFEFLNELSTKYNLEELKNDKQLLEITEYIISENQKDTTRYRMTVVYNKGETPINNIPQYMYWSNPL